MKLIHQWGLLSLLVFGITSCNPQSESIDHYFQTHTFQWVDPTSTQTPDSIYSKYVSAQMPAAELNPGELEFDVWYLIDLKDIDLEKTSYLEITKPRTKIAELYVLSDHVENKRLLENINANIVSLDRHDRFIIFKIASLTRQVTFYFQSFGTIQEAYATLQRNLFYVTMVIFLSALLLFYALWQSVKTQKPFYFLFAIIQLWYLFFLLYDTGFSRLWFGDQVHIWMGRISVLIYLVSILPFIYSHFRPDHTRAIRWLLISSVLVVGILLTMMVVIPITHSNSTIFVDCLRLFRLTSPLLILYFYKEWLKSTRDLIFTLIITFVAVVPILKSVQNTRLLEGPLFEHSFSVSMILQALLWFIYFGVNWKSSHQKRIELARKQQSLEAGYNKQLVKGQESERISINRHIQEELAPSIQTLQLLVENDKEKSKKELDRIVEELRYLSRLYISADLKKETLETEILRFIGLIKTIRPVEIILEYGLDQTDKGDQFLMINVYRLLQQGIMHSILNGNASTIIVQVLGAGDRISIIIEDNSKIDTMELVNDSKEMKNLKARLSDYEYQMRIHHRHSTGSSFEIELLNLKSA